MKIEFIKGTRQNLEIIEGIVRETIIEVYYKYYPKGVVEFFLHHHSRDNILKAIENEYIILIKVNDRVVGTGSLFKNEIKRMFILPEYQGRGYGNKLMDQLEKKVIEDGYFKVTLDSSLPGYSMYCKRGYKVKESNKIITNAGDILCYSTMEKELRNNYLYAIDYNNRIFTTKSNSDNGEVSDKTVFRYFQDGELVWAEYSGGEIVRGSLVGTADRNGNLDFVYQHINERNELRTGMCKSAPMILQNGKIRLSEHWRWTNGDKSCGESVIEEI